MSRLKELVNAVREDPELTPDEKETSITFTKSDERACVYTEEAGLMRRLLHHPAFDAAELHVTTDDVWGKHVELHAFSGGTITGVRGYIPIGTLKVRSRSRSTSGHASVVSRDTKRGEDP